MLAGEINRLFAHMRAPRADMIGNRRGGHISLEAEQVQAFFGGRAWQTIDLKAFSGYAGDKAACLSFMTPAALSYYYPAFLIMVLNDPIDDSELLEPTARVAADHSGALDVYNREQKICVAEWLLRVSGRYEILYREYPNQARDPLNIYETYWRSLLVPSNCND